MNQPCERFRQPLTGFQFPSFVCSGSRGRCLGNEARALTPGPVPGLCQEADIRKFAASRRVQDENGTPEFPASSTWIFTVALVRLRVSDRSDQRIGTLPRVQSSMLHDNRDIGLYYARVIDSSRYRRRVFQVVEPQVLCPVRRDGDPIRADRFPVRKISRNLHICIPVRSVEQTSGFVAGHLRFRSMTEFWNVAFSNWPAQPVPDCNRWFWGAD